MNNEGACAINTSPSFFIGFVLSLFLLIKCVPSYSMIEFHHMEISVQQALRYP